MSDALGSRLKLLRKTKPLSQEEMGAILGVSKTTISQYETGTHSPDTSVLRLFALYFNVSTDYLLGLTNITDSIASLLGAPQKTDNKTSVATTIGTRLKSLRLEKGDSQGDLGDVIGLSANTISQYENAISKPNVSLLGKFALYFKVSTDYLLGLTDIRHPADYLGRLLNRDVILPGQTSLFPLLITNDAHAFAKADLATFDPSSLEKLVPVPVYSNLWAADLALAKDKITGYNWVRDEEIADGECFFLLVNQDNMETAGIRDGGLVLIRKQDNLDDGDIGLVITPSTRPATITRFWQQGDMAILQTEEKTHRPRTFPLSDIQIVGKVVESRFKL